MTDNHEGKTMNEKQIICVDAKKLGAVALAQSKEATRYYLCGVLFENGKMIATNGHMMTIIESEMIEIEKGKQYIMPVSTKAITALKAKKSCYATFQDDVLTVTDLDHEILYMERSVAIDGTFPDYKKVIPTPSGITAHAAVGVKVMDIVCKTATILKHIDGAYGAIKIFGDGETDPHICKYPGVDCAYSVLMPIRT